jgi:N utilization substance protein A
MISTTELQAALKDLKDERAVSLESLLEALEHALISAYKRNYGSEANAIVTIDRDSGEYKVYHRRLVVENVTDPKIEVTSQEAGTRYEIGDYFDQEVTPKNFGRIAAQTAKQVIVQRIREAERDAIFNEFSGKLHGVVMGTVQRYEQRNMFVDLGRTEGLLPLSEQVQRENYRINDRIRAYVLDVRKANKGPSIILSRAAEGLVQRLLEQQVPELNEDLVEIMAISREPGSRSKVAVHSHRAEIDPVGACLGPKSSRIAPVTEELRGEKIDIIRWSPDQATFISNALSPAKVISVELYPEHGTALVIVPDYQLSLAIGREGQNVRLAARLTGWRLDITSEAEAADARMRYVTAPEEGEYEAEAVAEPELEEFVETPQAAEPVEEEAVEAAAPAIDQAEMIRKLEEFRKSMLERRGDET